MSVKNQKWFKSKFDVGYDEPTRKHKNYSHMLKDSPIKCSNSDVISCETLKLPSSDNASWMKKFEPKTVDDLAVNNKKIQEVDEWLNQVLGSRNSDILLLTGPVGCGKTATLKTLATKHGGKVTEWITPVDIDIPNENGEYEYKMKQSKQFLDFILNAANFTSLLDNNSKKIVLVEDLPNVFTRTPSELTEVLQQYKIRAKSPIVFICSDSHFETKNSAANLFTPALKEQFNMNIITFNAVSSTGLKAALKRVAEIISKNYKNIYNVPNAELIQCVVNSSTGDVRSAILNLHFACLKGSTVNLEKNTVMEKETKSTKKRKPVSSKFLSLGKDETVSILHGVGRVLNPKVVMKDGLKKLTHAPEAIMEQFTSQPSSFVNFIEENYLAHFSSVEHAAKAVSALSVADLLLTEWREKLCQEYGLYVSIAGLMLANQAPISAWNPVRGPKNMKIQYPSARELMLEENCLYKGKVLVTDYQTYCKIIGCKREEIEFFEDCDIIE